MPYSPLPLPPHFDPDRVAQLWRVPYQERAEAARHWAQQHGLRPAATDRPRIGLLIVDAQNTFCLPEFELFVGGRSGRGAVDDSRRLCEFIYRNLAHLTEIVATLDTHQAAQIFHAQCLVDAAGAPPAPHTQVSAQAVADGLWRFNPALAASLGLDPAEAQDHLRHYTAALQAGGQYALTIWPYHAMLGGLGHALVPAIEEALFFHSLARTAPTQLELKGREPLTEHYSALGPEVLTDARGRPLGQRNAALTQKLLRFDAVLIAGQAKSHCVAWTVQHLLDELRGQDPALAGRIYLLEDCTSPVVVPGVVDYTDQAEAAYQRFAAAGMHLVRSTDPLDTWLPLVA